MGKHRDWTEIRNEYQNTGISFARLAEKYDTSIVTIKKAAKREGWTKAQGKTAAAERILKRIPEQKDTVERNPATIKADAETRFKNVVEMLLEKAEAAAEFIPPEQVQALRQLTGVLKDLQGLLRMGKDELDIEEQKARIAKLKAEAENGGPPEPVVVKFVNREWTDAGA